MTTLKYVMDNQELTDDGYRLDQTFSLFNDEACDADYAAEDGCPFSDAVDEFWRMANEHPRSVSDVLDREKCAAVREIALTLFAPKSTLGDWQRRELAEALTSALTKAQIADALVCYGSAVNEFFRLKWLVAEHGGWRKEGAK